MLAIPGKIVLRNIILVSIAIHNGSNVNCLKSLESQKHNSEDHSFYTFLPFFADCLWQLIIFLFINSAGLAGKAGLQPVIMDNDGLPTQ